MNDPTNPMDRTNGDEQSSLIRTTGEAKIDSFIVDRFTSARITTTPSALRQLNNDGANVFVNLPAAAHTPSLLSTAQLTVGQLSLGGITTTDILISPDDDIESIKQRRWESPFILKPNEILLYAQLCQHYFLNSFERVSADWFCNREHDFIYSQNELYLKARYYQSQRDSNNVTIVLLGNQPNKRSSLTCIKDYLNFIPEALDALLKNAQFKHSTSNPNFTITLTGYLLGAAAAEILASRIRSHAVTFDSPGTKQILKTLIRSQPDCYFRYKKHSIITFLSTPNRYNTFSKQCATIKRLCIPNHFTPDWKHYARSILATLERTLIVSLMIYLIYSFWLLKSAASHYSFLENYHDLNRNQLNGYENDLRIAEKRQQDCLEYKEDPDTYTQLHRGFEWLTCMLEYDNSTSLTMLPRSTVSFFQDLVNSSKLALEEAGFEHYNCLFQMKLIALLLASYFILRVICHYFKNKSNLANTENQSLEQIVSSLQSIATEETALKKSRAIIDMASWPTSNQGWSFVGHTIKNLLFFRRYNLGVHNIFSENKRAEAEINQMNGYKIIN